MSQTGWGVVGDWDTAIKADGNYNPSPEPARCNWEPEMQPVMEREKGRKASERARELWCQEQDASGESEKEMQASIRAAERERD